MKNFVLALLIALVAFTSSVVGALLVTRQAAPSRSAGSALDSTAFTVIGTSSPMTVTGTSGQILATSTSAQWRMFQNNSAIGVWLNFGSDKVAVANQGVYLAGSSTLSVSLDQSNMYQGAVTAITSGGTATVLVNQK